MQFNKGMEKARQAAYSEDEYQDMSQFQRRGAKRSKSNYQDLKDDGSQFQGMGTEN